MKNVVIQSKFAIVEHKLYWMILINAISQRRSKIVFDLIANNVV